MEIRAKKLTVEAFDTFGVIVETPKREPTFQEDKFTYWKQVLQLQMGEVEVGILKVRTYDLLLNKMERHAETAEMLIPVDGSIIVPVAPPSDTRPNAALAEAFVVEKGQAVVLGSNCWHWIPCPVDKPEVTIMVIFKNNTSETDLIIEELTENCKVIY